MEQIGLYLLALIIPIIASININRTYSKYRTVNNSKKLSGFEVARKILDANGLNDMYIVEVHGTLSDHYDPSQKVVRLSTDVFHGESLASLAVAAHECGHAIQDKEGYSLFKLRSAIVPVVNFITNAAYVVFLISIFLQLVDLVMISVVMISAVLIFQLVTLPVELDASKRALKNLDDCSLVTKEEHEGAYKVLKAAAYTYIAAVLSYILDLIRVLMVSNRDDE